MKNKAQIRMSETIAILFIFFVLILFGLIFYFKYQGISLKEQQEETLANRAMDTTLKALFLPELICSEGNAESEDNCFDLMKIEHAHQVFQDNLNEYYFDMFSYANITVFQTYPTPEKYVLYEKVKPDYTRKEPTFFVVTLKNELITGEETYGFGYIVVEVFS